MDVLLTAVAVGKGEELEVPLSQGRAEVKDVGLMEEAEEVVGRGELEEECVEEASAVVEAQGVELKVPLIVGVRDALGVAE